MLCGGSLVLQAAISDCVSFDPFSFQQDGLGTPEVDVSRGLDCSGSRGSGDGCSDRRTYRFELRGRRADSSFRARCGFSPRPNIACASPGECLARSARTTIWRVRISGSSPLLDGYDEPEILLSSNP